MSKLDDLRKEMKALKSKMTKEGKVLLEAGIKEFLEAHPIVEKVCWEQYTPYWNDGSPCVFSVQDFWLKFNKTAEQKAEDREQEKKLAKQHNEKLTKWAGYLDSDESAREDYDMGVYSYGDEERPFPKKEKAAIKAINKLYKDVVDEDIFHDLFGDHVSVKADRKGFHVKEHEHD